jgi:hypothetical protein
LMSFLEKRLPHDLSLPFKSHGQGRWRSKRLFADKSADK